MNIAIIPARGGSKRIERKNVREFCGRPIMAYSVESAVESGLFDRIVVSTDCAEIAELAKSLGAEVPFLRPSELANDFTPTIPVIRHALDALEDEKASIAYVCCIYATAPFVMVQDLEQSYSLLREDKGAAFAFPVTTYAFPILRSLRMEGNRVEMFFPEHEGTRSQDLPEGWHDAGQFYWGRTEAWRSEAGIFSATSIGLPIPRFRVQDIDTIEDWHRAELMFEALRRTTRE